MQETSHKGTISQNPMQKLREGLKIKTEQKACGHIFFEIKVVPKMETKGVETLWMHR